MSLTGIYADGSYLGRRRCRNDTRQPRRVQAPRKGKIYMAAAQRVLLVDDYEVNRIVARKHLEGAGYRVDAAVDGSAAIEALKHGSYDLVMMDIEMPGMDGWETTKQIRSLEGAAGNSSQVRVPIIAMSGHVLEDDIERYQLAGMDDCMAKPIERAKLLAVVSKWLDESPAVKSEAVVCSRVPYPDERTGADAAPIDLDKAVAEFMGDRATVQQVLKEFVRRGSQQISTIEQALVAADLEQIRFEAHALRGGAANLTADRLADSCAGMEAAAAAAGTIEPGQLSPLFSVLKYEFKRLAKFVSQTDGPAGSAGKSCEF